jgi:WD40 repeat protein/serine/threonine protein kinase
MSDTQKDINIIFLEVVEKPTAEERAAYLDDVCRDNDALRADLESLLRAHERSGGFLETPIFKSEVTLDSPPISEIPGTVIGRYKLLEKIGEGGFGVVWVAEQKKPVKRRVALKIIKLGMDTKQVVARFEAERQALALMDHPNIAKVLDAGSTDSGRPYFVMELVRGIPITRYCDQEKLPIKDRLSLFIKVCNAVQHAHQKGIIHRDIKPSNIMVTMHDGIPVPRIIDFGIAKATQQELTEKTIYTQHHQFIGTPAYMSPEQAEMSGLDIDTRSDIYSLGVLLYELLTGRTPFDEKELIKSGIDQMRKIIREQEPPKPSTKFATLEIEEQSATALRHATDYPRLISLIRGDLDWIVMKCLEKDRTRRYETANGLAVDITRHLNNEPVIARSPTVVYRIQKAWRRNKVIYSAGILVVLSLIAGIAISVWQARRAQINEQKAVQAQTNEAKLRAQAQAQELVARQRAYASDMNVAKQALAAGNPGRALDLLDLQRPKPGQRDLRGWEWRYLWQQTRSDALFTLCRQSSEIHSLAVSSDGHWLAVGVYHKGGLSVWDLRTRQQVIQLAEDEARVEVAFSPTEPLLVFTGVIDFASGERQVTLHLYNMVTRQMMDDIPLDALCKGLAFSKDGKTLVTSTARPSPDNRLTSSRGTITLWHMPDGTQLTAYPTEQGAMGPATAAFAATPDLSLAAYGLQQKRIRVLDLRDGKELWPPVVASTQYIIALAFSPDGKTLASAAGFDDDNIRLWDVASGKEIGRLEGHGAFICSLVFWPDGKTLASSSQDQTIRIWDVASRTCLDVLRGHRLEVFRLALLPDGKTLVSGCKDGTVCVWDTAVTHPRQPRITLPGRFAAWCFAPDGQSILTAGEKGVTRWSGLNFAQRESLPDIGSNGFKSPVFSREGHYLAADLTDSAIHVWDLQKRTLRCQLTDITDSVPLDFFGDGNRLVTWSGDSIDAWDLVTERKTHSWQVPMLFILSPNNHSLAISPDARQLIAIGWDGDTLCAGLDNGSQRSLDLPVLEASSAAYSPDGGLFAVSSALGYARVWDTATWREQVTMRGYFGGLASVTFSPDGKRLATGSGYGQALRLWDTDSWRDVLTLEGQGSLFYALAFSPDGSVIGARSAVTGNVQLWRAPSWEDIAAAEAKER